ncbi:MAG: DUF4437 domain-containing protein [Paracoccaceae bacterium]
MRLSILATLVFATSAQANSITLTPDTDLDWETTPEGVAFAPLHGDRFAGSYIAMVRLPSGTISPPHIKTADMMGLMVSGLMTHHPHPSGADAERIGPGAYYHIPAGLAHVSSCVSDTPCITLLYQNGPFDFNPVTP